MLHQPLVGQRPPCTCEKLGRWDWPKTPGLDPFQEITGAQSREWPWRADGGGGGEHGQLRHRTWRSSPELGLGHPHSLRNSRGLGPGAQESSSLVRRGRCGTRSFFPKPGCLLYCSITGLSQKLDREWGCVGGPATPTLPASI